MKEPKLPNQEKLVTTKTIEIDWPYGTPAEIISYMQELVAQYGKDCQIYDKWTGYEDHYLFLCYDVVESDKDYKFRLASELAYYDAQMEKYQQWLVSEERAKQIKAEKKEANRKLEIQRLEAKLRQLKGV